MAVNGVSLPYQTAPRMVHESDARCAAFNHHSQQGAIDEVTFDAEVMQAIQRMEARWQTSSSSHSPDQNAKESVLVASSPEEPQKFVAVQASPVDDESLQQATASFAAHKRPRRSRAAAVLTCVICQEDKTHQSKWLSASACGHAFCAPCIERWAQSCSQCPLCKSEMGSLVPVRPCGNTNTSNSKIFQSDASSAEAVLVPPRRLRLEEDEDANEDAALEVLTESEVVCEVCNNGGAESLLLLCDACDAAYHTFCLSPRLNSVPRGQWFCPRCAPPRRRRAPALSPSMASSRFTVRSATADVVVLVPAADGTGSGSTAQTTEPPVASPAQVRPRRLRRLRRATADVVVPVPAADGAGSGSTAQTTEPPVASPARVRPRHLRRLRRCVSSSSAEQ